MAAAREAGRVIVRHYGQGTVAVETKSDSSPVTAADREANATILACLAGAFPDDALLSEEAPDDRARLVTSRVWIVDPLDGTRDFVARTGDFCVHVGLAVDGKATVGVVHHPLSGATFFAARGAGAFVEEPDGTRTRLGVSAVGAPSDVRLGISRLNPSGDLLRALVAAHLDQQTVAMGASVKLMALARGTLDGVVNFSTEMEWDTCAPEVIIREAGGMFTDLDGRGFDYNRADLARRGSLASNGACHAALLALLRPHFRPDGGPP